MTNAELEHHLGVAFRLLKEQSDAMRRMTEMINQHQHISATADQTIERAIVDMREKVNQIEVRLHEIVDCPDCPKHGETIQ